MINTLTDTSTLLFSFRNYPVCDRGHSLKRYRQLIGDDTSPYMTLVKKSVAFILTTKCADVHDRYLFCSKNYGFAVHLDWMYDERTSDFGGFSLTTLSPKEVDLLRKFKDSGSISDSLQQSGCCSIEDWIVEKKFFSFNPQELGYELEHTGLSLFLEGGNSFHDFDIVEIDDCDNFCTGSTSQDTGNGKG